MRLLTKYLRPSFSYSLRSPINLDLLKSDQGKKNLEKSLNARFKNSSFILEKLSISYEQFRKSLFEFEALGRETNNIKKQIKDMVKTGKQQQIEELKKELTVRKETLLRKQNEVKQVQKYTEQLLLSVGNIVSSQTPISKNQKDNRVIRYYHPRLQNSKTEVNPSTDHASIVDKYFAVPNSNNPDSVSYEELNTLFKISDLSRGQKVSGHRGYFLCTNGVKLALAIAQYGLDFLEKRGYSLYQTPALILEDVLRDSCQLQTIEADMYRFPKDNLCLIATSQQTLAGYYKGETLEVKSLSLRMGGYSSCFRRQAGAHGKDIHGLFRLHQFEKIEQFVVCHPKQSENQMKRMLQTSEQFYQSLKIPYRVVDIVSGQLNDAAARKLDIEAWFPSQQRFRELVSISNCTDYQSRLLQTKYREGASTKYVHMLNGTLVAVQRAITCFTEHFFNKSEMVLDIPEALQPYIRTKAIEKPK